MMQPPSFSFSFDKDFGTAHKANTRGFCAPLFARLPFPRALVPGEVLEQIIIPNHEA
jgi:hypothetical protein